MRGILRLLILVSYTTAQCLAVDSTNSPAPEGDRAPGGLQMLLSHIAAADRVVATNWVGGGIDEKPFSMLLPPEVMGKIANAFSIARNAGAQEHPDLEWDWQLQFYAGAKRTDVVCFNRGSFLAHGVWQDETGVLEKIYSDCARQEYLNRIYKDEEKDFAAEKKVEAKRWLKSSLHLPYRENKAKVLRYVNAFYSAGAVEVLMANLRKRAIGKAQPLEEARLMLVVLPQTSEARRKVFDVVREAPREWMNDPDPDVGQKYLWYSFDWNESE
jgi:hypothetical protein